MDQTNKRKQPDQNSKDPARFIDEVTENKIDRHLHDINDTITGEDIKNVISDISSSDLPDNEIENIDNERLDIEDDTEDKNDKQAPPPTSWNLLE